MVIVMWYCVVLNSVVSYIVGGRGVVTCMCVGRYDHHERLTAMEAQDHPFFNRVRHLTPATAVPFFAQQPARTQAVTGCTV